jgi:hypothetical protein
MVTGPGGERQINDSRSETITQPEQSAAWDRPNRFREISAGLRQEHLTVGILYWIKEKGAAAGGKLRGKSQERTRAILRGLTSGCTSSARRLISGCHFSTEIVSDAVWTSELVIAHDPVNGGTLVTKFAPLLMEKLPGNQIEYKLFGFFTNQLHRHFV